MKGAMMIEQVLGAHCGRFLNLRTPTGQLVSDREESALQGCQKPSFLKHTHSTRASTWHLALAPCEGALTDNVAGRRVAADKEVPRAAIPRERS